MAKDYCDTNFAFWLNIFSSRHWQRDLIIYFQTETLPILDHGWQFQGKLLFSPLFCALVGIITNKYPYVIIKDNPQVTE